MVFSIVLTMEICLDYELNRHTLHLQFIKEVTKKRYNINRGISITNIISRFYYSTKSNGGEI